MNLAGHDRKLGKLICGIIKRHAADVLVDPYANAFNRSARAGAEPPAFPAGAATHGAHRGFGPLAQHDAEFQGDRRTPPMQPHVYEVRARARVHNARSLSDHAGGTRVRAQGKYELDSLASVLRLASYYYDATDDLGCFDSTWINAVELIADTIDVQTKARDARRQGGRQASEVALPSSQGTDEEGSTPPYSFFRSGNGYLGNNGRGPRAGSCGVCPTSPLFNSHDVARGNRPQQERIPSIGRPGRPSVPGPQPGGADCAEIVMCVCVRADPGQHDGRSRATTGRTHCRRHGGRRSGSQARLRRGAGLQG
jgi:hypothetical protein